MSTRERGRPAGIDVVERRTDLLDALVDQPRDQRDLRDAIGVSRSTVYKALRELVESGLVREATDGRYHLTQYGRLLRRVHDAYAGRLARLAAAEPVVSALPGDLLVPLAFVERGCIYTADRHAPERPFTEMEAFSYDTESYRCLSPIAVTRYMGRIHERVECGELTAELLVEQAAADHLRTYERFDDLLAEETFSLRTTLDRVPYGLLIADDHETVALFAYGEEGAVRGLLISDAPEAYAWADRRYREFAEEATTL